MNKPLLYTKTRNLSDSNDKVAALNLQKLVPFDSLYLIRLPRAEEYYIYYNPLSGNIRVSTRLPMDLVDQGFSQHESSDVSEFLSRILMNYLGEEAATHSRGGLGKYVHHGSSWWVLTRDDKRWTMSSAQDDAFIPLGVSNQTFEIFNGAESFKHLHNGHEVEYFSEISMKWEPAAYKSVNDIKNFKWMRIKPDTSEFANYDIEIPSPAKCWDDLNGKAYFPSFQEGGYTSCTWEVGNLHELTEESRNNLQELLDAGLLHSTKEAAIAHSKALIEINAKELK